MSQDQQQGKYWCFTFFPTDSSLSIEDVYRHLHGTLPCSYFCAQGELSPTTGSLHYQGYLERSANVRLRRLRGAFPAHRSLHLERRRGTAAEADAYCRKGDQPVPGHPFISFGDISVPQQGRRSDIEAYATALGDGASDASLFGEFPGTHLRFFRHAAALRSQFLSTQTRVTPKVEIHWGPTGAGKTHHVYASHAASDIYRVMDPRSRNDIPWMDGYIGQPVIFFDEFTGQAPLGWLLQVCDKYPLMAQIKGGTTYIVPLIIYFASNINPTEWWPEAHLAQTDAFFRRVTLTKEYEPRIL